MMVREAVLYCRLYDASDRTKDEYEKFRKDQMYSFTQWLSKNKKYEASKTSFADEWVSRRNAKDRPHLNKAIQYCFENNADLMMVDLGNHFHDEKLNDALAKYFDQHCANEDTYYQTYVDKLSATEKRNGIRYKVMNAISIPYIKAPPGWSGKARVSSHKKRVSNKIPEVHAPNLKLIRQIEQLQTNMFQWAVNQINHRKQKIDWDNVCLASGGDGKVTRHEYLRYYWLKNKIHNGKDFEVLRTYLSVCGNRQVDLIEVLIRLGAKTPSGKGKIRRNIISGTKKHSTAVRTDPNPRNSWYENNLYKIKNRTWMKKE